MRRIPHPKLALSLVIVVSLLLLLGIAGQLGLFWMPMSASGPGTLSNGAISIATDHSRYDASDAVHVTLTNHLTQEVLLWEVGGCLPLFVEQQTGTSWRLQACGGGAGEASQGNGYYHLPLSPGASLQQHFLLQGKPYAGDPGRYRFTVLYAWASPKTYIVYSSQARITSQTFEVCNCQDCPFSS